MHEGRTLQYRTIQDIGGKYRKKQENSVVNKESFHKRYPHLMYGIATSHKILEGSHSNIKGLFSKKAIAQFFEL